MFTLRFFGTVSRKLLTMIEFLSIMIYSAEKCFQNVDYLPPMDNFKFGDRDDSGRSRLCHFRFPINVSDDRKPYLQPQNHCFQRLVEASLSLVQMIGVKNFGIQCFDVRALTGENCFCRHQMISFRAFEF